MPKEMNLQRVDVKPNYALSNLDKAFIAINYPFPKDYEKSSDSWSLSKAFTMAGVGASTQESLTQLWSDENYTQMRLEFSVWTSTQHKSADTGTGKAGTGGTSHGIKEGGIQDWGWCSTEETKGTTAASTGAQHAVNQSLDLLWGVGQVVKYAYQQGDDIATPYRKARVEEAFATYSTIANLSFAMVSEGEPNDVRIFFGTDMKSDLPGWAATGTGSTNYNSNTTRPGLRNTTLYLSRIPETDTGDDDDLKEEFRNVFHEIGHVMGLSHEHQSPVTQTTDTPFNLNGAGVYTSYDPLSVMLYADHDLKAGGRTMWNTIPSDKDKALLGVSCPFLLYISLLTYYAPQVLYPRPWVKGDTDIKFAEKLDTLEVGLPNIGKLVTQYQKLYTENTVGSSGFTDALKSLREAISLRVSSAAQAKLARNGVVTGGTGTGGKKSDISKQPLRDLGPKASKQEPTQGDFLPVMRQSLAKFFAPSGNQMFALQFPGRFLQKSLYAWDTTTAGIYGQFIKPPAVLESEFRLVDQLYDAAGVVAGPNGMNLSLVYEQLLNNLIPASQDTGLAKRQSKIRQWLIKDVKAAKWIQKLLDAQHSRGQENPVAKLKPTTTSDGASKPMFGISDKLTEENTITRLELSEALMEEYLNAKQNWESERDMMISEALKLRLGTKESSDALDSLNRTLAHLTATREAQLASKYADAVVRGYYHTIQEYLGYLDIKSSSEFLQDAKNALRESAASSFDGSLKIYPVQLSPVDWFEGLSTNFTMEDLTSDPSLITQQIDAKSQQLDFLNSQLALLQGAKKGDVEQLQRKVDDAQAGLDDAMGALATAYSSNVISMAQTCITAYGELNEAELATTAGKLKIAGAALTELTKGMQKVADAQKKLNASARAFTQLLASRALAEATDTQQQQKQLQLQITATSKEIQELTGRCRTLNKSSAPTTAVVTTLPSVDDVKLYPAQVTSGGSRWQDISLYHKFEKKDSATLDQASASQSSVSANFWIGSYNRSESSSSALFKSSNSAESYNVQFGFRATLVTVDRGGWFQPQFFKESKAFNHINPHLSWSKWPGGAQTVDALKQLGDSALAELNKSLLPTFPVGYVICKVSLTIVYLRGIWLRLSL